jgi:hypothetical protein
MATAATPTAAPATAAAGVNTPSPLIIFLFSGFQFLILPLGKSFPLFY